jgi:hypothetical protein
MTIAEPPLTKKWPYPFCNWYRESQTPIGGMSARVSTSQPVLQEMQKHAAAKKRMQTNSQGHRHQRVLSDGDLVAVHAHVRLNPGDLGVATIHIFRFEDDRIVELWDVGQAVPENSLNDNGMF